MLCSAVVFHVHLCTTWTRLSAALSRVACYRFVLRGFGFNYFAHFIRYFLSNLCNLLRFRCRIRLRTQAVMWEMWRQRGKRRRMERKLATAMETETDRSTGRTAAMGMGLRNIFHSAMLRTPNSWSSLTLLVIHSCFRESVLCKAINRISIQLLAIKNSPLKSCSNSLWNTVFPTRFPIVFHSYRILPIAWMKRMHKRSVFRRTNGNPHERRQHDVHDHAAGVVPRRHWTQIQKPKNRSQQGCCVRNFHEGRVKWWMMGFQRRPPWNSSPASSGRMGRQSVHCHYSYWTRLVLRHEFSWKRRREHEENMHNCEMKDGGHWMIEEMWRGKVRLEEKEGWYDFHFELCILNERTNEGEYDRECMYGVC